MSESTTPFSSGTSASPPPANGNAPGLQNRLQMLRRRHTKVPNQNEIRPLGGPIEGRNAEEISIALVAFIDLLRKRLWLIILLSIGLGALIYQWSRARPKIYRSTAIVEVVMQSPQVFSNIRDVISLQFQFRRFYATQLVILRSNAIAQKALQQVEWVLNSPGFYGLDKIKDKAKQRGLMAQMRPTAFNILKGKTTVTAIRRSSLFQITVQDTDPHRASQLASAIAEAYKEHNLQFRLRATNNAYSKIKAQRERFEQMYRELERKVIQFRQKNNLLTTSLDDRRNLAFKRLEEINNRLTQVMLRRLELVALVRPFSGSRKNKKKNRIDTSFPPLLKHELYWKLKERESQLSLDMEVLNSKYRDKHPSVQRGVRQIKRLHQIMEGQQDLVFESYLQQLSAVRREEQSLQRKVYAATHDLQRIEKLNLYLAQMGERKNELKRSLNFLNKRFFEIQLLKDSTATNVRTIEVPRIAKNPFSPRVMRDTAVGTLLSFLGLFGLFFLLELFDRSIRSIEDVELKAGLVPLGEIPLFSTKKKKQAKDLLYNPNRPLSQIEEAIRTIRTNVLFMTSDSPVRKILFTSPAPREGKTFVACNMAIGIAHTGKRTILIDTDMRRPRVHKALQLDYDRSKGVSSVIIGQHTLEEAMIPMEYPNLWVLPCGPVPPSPTELLQTEGFYKMLAELEEKFEVVLFDSPPINHVADAAVLTNYVDGVLMISSCGSTSWNALQAAAKRIEAVGGRVLGCILNKFSRRHRRSYYYGTYGGYYSPYRYQQYEYTSNEND